MKHTEKKKKSNSGHSYSEKKNEQQSHKVCVNCHCSLKFCMNISVIGFMHFYREMHKSILLTYFWQKGHDRKEIP